MKIVHLSPAYFPHIGGVETHLKEVNKVLVQDGHEVTVVTVGTEKLTGIHIVEQVKVIRMAVNDESGWAYKLSLWREMRQLWPVLKAADVIHIHDVFFWILPFLPWLWWEQKPIFMTFHGYEAPGPLTRSQIFWHRCAAALSQGNMCVGDFHRKWYGVNPTVVTYGGVPESKVNKNRPKKTGTLKIIFVGRLAVDTGIKEYLLSLKHLELPQKVELDVFGEGPLRLELESFVTEELGKNKQVKVNFYGFVPDANQKMFEYDLAFVSQYLAILAALKQGVPVVSIYNTDIKRDYLMMTPFAEWITITASPDEIARALKKWSSLGKHVKKAHNWASKQTWQKVTHVYYSLWKLNHGHKK